MVEERVQRRLAAILAADVVGYSRLMGADEETTLRTLKSHREIIDRLIARHEGRVFSTAGDSVVAEFRSAVEAVFERYHRQRHSLATKFLQSVTIENKKRMKETDPEAIKANHRQLRETSEDPIKAKVWLMRSSLLDSMRKEKLIE